MRTKQLPPLEKRCQHRDAKGRPCRAARMHDSSYCFFHDPAAREGSLGIDRLEELRLGKPSTIHQLLAEVVEGVRKKRVNPQQAYALGWLVQLLMQNLDRLEGEERKYHQQSYGRVFAGRLRELLTETSPEAKDEAEETEGAEADSE